MNWTKEARFPGDRRLIGDYDESLGQLDCCTRPTRGNLWVRVIRSSNILDTTGVHNIATYGITSIVPQGSSNERSYSLYLPSHYVRHYVSNILIVTLKVQF